MKARITLKGPRGWMAEKTIKISMVADITPALLKFLDGLPDTIEDQAVMDWTGLDIQIEREL